MCHSWIPRSTPGPHLTRDALIVGKSTVPVAQPLACNNDARSWRQPGITGRARLEPRIPPRGFAVADTQRPDQIVVGTDSDDADALLREVYAAQIADGVAYLDGSGDSGARQGRGQLTSGDQISFINAMAEVCERAGADVTARQRSGLRQANRVKVLASRARVRRRLSQAGHPRIHGTGRANLASTTHCRSSRKSTTSACASAAAPQTPLSPCSGQRE